MNKGLIAALAFTAGGATGYFVTKKLLEDYYMEQADITIEKENEWHKKKCEKCKGYPLSREGKKQTEKNEEKENEKKDAETEKKGRTRKEKKAYNLVKTQKKDAEEEKQSEEPEGKTTSDKKMIPPYTVTPEEFMNNPDEYDQISLFFYRLDDVICEENENPVDNVDELLGDDEDVWAALNNFPTVYVRNEKMQTDYEVICVDSSYAEMVHGIHPE